MTTQDTAVKWLRIPLTLIEHVDDVKGFQGLDEQRLQAVQRDYTPDEITGIVSGLRFAEAHPQYDFASLIIGLNRTNAEIYPFLMKILRSLEAANLAPER